MRGRRDEVAAARAKARHRALMRHRRAVRCGMETIEAVSDEPFDLDEAFGAGRFFVCKACGEPTYLGPVEGPAVGAVGSIMLEMMAVAVAAYVERGLCAGCGGRMGELDG